MSNSSNAGRTERELQRLRKEDPSSATTMGYENSGVATPVLGDDEGPWLKVPPFSSLPALWDEFAFAAPDYRMLPVLEIAQIRTVTTYLKITGLAEDNTSQLSVVAGTYLPTEPGEPISLDNFFTIAVIDPTPTDVTLLAPFNSMPAISRSLMPGELRTEVIPVNTALYLVLQWDVSPYQNFTLYMRDLSDTPLASVRVHYAYAS